MEDRADIFVIATEGSIKWGITKANLFSTPSLLAVHLTTWDLWMQAVTLSCATSLEMVILREPRKIISVIFKKTSSAHLRNTSELLVD
jgi:hypothetical protein